MMDREARVLLSKRLARTDGVRVHVEGVQPAARRECGEDAARVSAAAKRRVDVHAARIGRDDLGDDLAYQSGRVCARRLQRRSHARVRLLRRGDAQVAAAKAAAVPSQRFGHALSRGERDPPDTLALTRLWMRHEPRSADHAARLGKVRRERLLRRVGGQVLQEHLEALQLARSVDGAAVGRHIASQSSRVYNVCVGTSLCGIRIRYPGLSSESVSDSVAA